MTTEELAGLFEKHEKEFIEFERVENPVSSRRDLCALIMLNRLVPGTDKIISAAEHDVVYLGVNAEALAAVATEADVLTLIRCGVILDEDGEYFQMFY